MAKSERQYWEDALNDKETFIGGLSSELRSEFVNVIQTRRLPKGHILFLQGDPFDKVYLIVEGFLKLSVVLDSGDQNLIGVLGPGDIVGELSLLDGEARSANAELASSTLLGSISKEDFEGLLTKNPEMYPELLRVMAHRLRVANETSGETALLGLEARILRLIYRLVKLYGEPYGPGAETPMGPADSETWTGPIRVRYKLTQADLGRLTHGSRESVNKILQKLRRDGLIDLVSRFIVVPSVSTLRNQIDGNVQHEEMNDFDFEES